MSKIDAFKGHAAPKGEPGIKVRDRRQIGARYFVVGGLCDPFSEGCGVGVEGVAGESVGTTTGRDCEAGFGFL